MLHNKRIFHIFFVSAKYPKDMVKGFFQLAAQLFHSSVNFVKSTSFHSVAMLTLCVYRPATVGKVTSGRTKIRHP